MQASYQSKILDHLGLVAAMCDELEIAQQIDQAIPQDREQRIVTVGQAVKAMILNGLGFVNQRLYLMPQFFETKPTERLLGEGIRPEHLNDDSLGRALDSLYDYGVTELFRDVAAHAAQRLGLRPRFVHLDATSFHVDGKYNSEEEADAIAEGVVHVRQGYSRDHRPELNQVVLDLMVEHRAGLPVLMQPLSGNSSDQGDFPKLIERHLSGLQQAYGFDYIVADSALYSAEHIQRLSERGAKFITRVPETIQQAKTAIAEVDLEALVPLVEGYHAQVLSSDYGGVAQRWVLILSEAARARAEKTAQKTLGRVHEQERKAFRELSERVFACRTDAERALEIFTSSLKISRVEDPRLLECMHYGQLGAPEEHPQRSSYRIEGHLVFSETRRAEYITRKSLFILATNELSAEALSDKELLSAYKGQSRIERGFRFLKDPLFLASSLYLKNEKRIMALLMVMTLCLLVYAALEYRIREGLRQQGRAFPDQKGKPSARPTARWVFQCFVGIHVLMLEQQELVLNLSDRHTIILEVLGRRYEQHYSSRAP